MRPLRVRHIISLMREIFYQESQPCLFLVIYLTFLMQHNSNNCRERDRDVVVLSCRFHHHRKRRRGFVLGNLTDPTGGVEQEDEEEE